MDGGWETCPCSPVVKSLGRHVWYSVTCAIAVVRRFNLSFGPVRRVHLLKVDAKKTNEWVLNKAGVKRELLDTVKARKLAYYGHTMRNKGIAWRKK